MWLNDLLFGSAKVQRIVDSDTVVVAEPVVAATTRSAIGARERVIVRRTVVGIALRGSAQDQDSTARHRGHSPPARGGRRDGFCCSAWSSGGKRRRIANDSEEKKE